MVRKLFFKHFVYLPLTRFQRMNIIRSLSEFTTTQYYNTSTLNDLREQSLLDLINYARDNVPYYVNIPHINTLNELCYLPVLTKQQIQENFNALTSREKFQHVMHKSTGGSTGTPLILKHTNIVHERHLAAMWRGYSWAGIDIGDKRGHFWSTPVTTKKLLLSKIQDFITNRRRYSAFKFQPHDLDLYINDLNKFKPFYFYGFSSMLEKIALYMLEKNVKLNFIPQAIITTSEMLSSNRREVIENAFNTRVYNEYGCGEVGTISHECEHGSMHINAENLIVEILDDNNNPVPNGEMGNVVVTLLHNKVMPIIRYKIGDISSLQEELCSCGRTLPIMSPPIGRVLDYLKKKDGTSYYGNIIIHTLMQKLNSSSICLRQIQIIQHDYNRFTMNIVPGISYTDNITSFLQQEVYNLFGNNTDVQIQLTNEIPRAASGKLRNVICEV